MIRNSASQPPVPSDLLKYEQQFAFGDNAMALADGQSLGGKALQSPDAPVKNTLVLRRGYKIHANKLSAEALETAIDDALAQK